MYKLIKTSRDSDDLSTGLFRSITVCEQKLLHFRSQLKELNPVSFFLKDDLVFAEQ